MRRNTGPSLGNLHHEEPFIPASEDDHSAFEEPNLLGIGRIRHIQDSEPARVIGLVHEVTVDVEVVVGGGRHAEVFPDQDGTVQVFGLIPPIALGAAVFLTLWMLYFRGKILPDNKLREKRILHAFRLAKPRHYGTLFLLRSPALLSAVVVYTIALNLFGVEASFASSRGHLFDHATDFLFVTSGLAGAAIAGRVPAALPVLIAVSRLGFLAGQGEIFPIMIMVLSYVLVLSTVTYIIDRAIVPRGADRFSPQAQPSLH